MLKVLILGFFVISSVLGVEIARDNLRETSTPSPIPNVMGVQSIPSPTPIPTPKSTIKQTTANPTIDCTGPDGIQFKTTQEECDEFNAAWGQKSQTLSQYSQAVDLVDCYYKNESGIIMYDYGKQSRQKCNDLANSWWNTRQQGIQYNLATECIKTAKSRSDSCWNQCSRERANSFDECTNACDVTFRSALSSCY